MQALSLTHTHMHINTCMCEELHNATEFFSHASTQRNHVLDSSFLNWVASSTALQGACDCHWNPPFIYEQSLNNMDLCRCPATRAHSGDVRSAFSNWPRACFGDEERGNVLGDWKCNKKIEQHAGLMRKLRTLFNIRLKVERDWKNEDWPAADSFFLG